MLRKFVLAFVLVMLLSTLGSAKNDSVITGPYKISFDIGLTRNDYTVTVNQPKATEGLSGDKRTEYTMYIVNNTDLNRFIGITIRSFETPITVDSGSDAVPRLNSIYLNNPRYSGLRTNSRTIDGTVGGIASFTAKLDSGLISDDFQIDYQPVFDPTHTVVEMFSTYPWDEETLKLLKTIHVERVHS